MKVSLLRVVAMILAAAIISYCGTAAAQAIRLKGLGGGDTVFVWKDKEAHNRAMQLIEAGVAKTNPGLIFPLMSCMVPSGTRAIITSGGIVTQDIQIIDGDNIGCEGNVPTENIDR